MTLAAASSCSDDGKRVTSEALKGTIATPVERFIGSAGAATATVCLP